MRNFRKATKEVFIPKVKPDNGAHATSNRGYVCYSGEETASHSPSEGAIRASALQTLDDMEERFDTDFPNLSPRKFMPGAMGVRVTQATGTEQCYEIYYHSSMRQHKAPLFDGRQVALIEKFQQLVLRTMDISPIIGVITAVQNRVCLRILATNLQGVLLGRACTLSTRMGNFFHLVAVTWALMQDRLVAVTLLRLLEPSLFQMDLPAQPPGIQQDTFGIGMNKSDQRLLVESVDERLLA
jgi:hypothetical protein